MLRNFDEGSSRLLPAFYFLTRILKTYVERLSLAEAVPGSFSVGLKAIHARSAYRWVTMVFKKIKNSPQRSDITGTAIPEDLDLSQKTLLY